MSFDAEDMKDYRREQQERRAKRLPIRTDEIMELGKVGWEIVKFTDYQYRINGKIDVYPIHRKYHILKGGKRGTYPENGLKEFLEKNKI